VTPAELLQAAADGLVGAVKHLADAQQYLPAVRTLDQGYLSKSVGSAELFQEAIKLLLKHRGELHQHPFDQARLDRAVAVARDYRSEDWAEAEKNLRSAERLFLSGGPDARLDLAETQTHLGRVLFNRSGEAAKQQRPDAAEALLAEAQTTYASARSILEAIEPQSDRAGKVLAHLALNEATAIEKPGDTPATERALKILNGALRQLPKEGASEVEVQLLYNSGRLLNQLEQYPDALVLLRGAQARLTDSMAAGITYQQLGIALVHGATDESVSGTDGRQAAWDAFQVSWDAFRKAGISRGANFTKFLVEQNKLPPLNGA
jgi:hypothetical protein